MSHNPQPSVFRLKDLLNSVNTVSCGGPDGYYPARPYGNCIGILARLKAAWLVWTGEADAVIWPNSPQEMAGYSRGNEAAVRSLVARIARWQACMSYNSSYFGEPEGMLKGCVEELRWLLDLGSKDFAPWKEHEDAKIDAIASGGRGKV